MSEEEEFLCTSYPEKVKERSVWATTPARGETPTRLPTERL